MLKHLGLTCYLLLSATNTSFAQAWPEKGAPSDRQYYVVQRPDYKDMGGGYFDVSQKIRESLDNVDLIVSVKHVKMSEAPAILKKQIEDLVKQRTDLAIEASKNIIFPE